MTEAGMMGAEDADGGGFRIWTDMFFIEVLDPTRNAPVAEGEVGSLVVTPLWTNNVTPFLRWSSGDLVTWREGEDGDGPFSVFPLVKHAHRTTGFFKVRGINLNHSEFEDFMFRNAAIARLQGRAGQRARSRRAAPLDRGAARHARRRRSSDGAANLGARYLRADARGRRAGCRHARQGIRGERENAALCRPAAIGGWAECAAPQPQRHGDYSELARSGRAPKVRPAVRATTKKRNITQRGEHENRNHTPRRDGLPAVAHAAQAQEKLKIGFIATLSGPPAVLGTQMRNGFLLGSRTSAASSADARSRSSCRTTNSSRTSR